MVSAPAWNFNPGCKDDSLLWLPDRVCTLWDYRNSHTLTHTPIQSMASPTLAAAFHAFFHFPVHSWYYSKIEVLFCLILRSLMQPFIDKYSHTNGIVSFMAGYAYIWLSVVMFVVQYKEPILTKPAKPVFKYTTHPMAWLNILWLLFTEMKPIPTFSPCHLYHKWN